MLSTCIIFYLTGPCGKLKLNYWLIGYVYCPCWYHDMETVSVLLALCKGNPSWLMDSPHKGSVVRRSFIFFDIILNKLFNKQWRCRWFQTPWHARDATIMIGQLSILWSKVILISVLLISLYNRVELVNAILFAVCVLRCNIVIWGVIVWSRSTPVVTWPNSQGYWQPK